MFAPIHSLTRRRISNHHLPTPSLYRRLLSTGDQSNRPYPHTSTSTMEGPKAEEVEVKLRLPNSHSHENLLKILSPYHITTHFQENIFLDGPNSQLTTARAALRLRFYNDDRRCVLGLKSQPTFTSGVSRAEEVEIEVEPHLGRVWVAEPWKLGRDGPRPNWVLDRAREIAGWVMEEFDGWVCLGGFRNVRNVFDYRDLRLEVDETLFEFGTNYEVECESEKPEEAKRVIEKLLVENGIGFSYSQESKFAVFRSGKLPV